MFASVTVNSEITSILHNCHQLNHSNCQLWILYLHVCSVHNFLLSSTQSEVASRDANIRQLEEKCELLEAQVSLAICVFCDTVVYVMVWTSDMHTVCMFQVF